MNVTKIELITAGKALINSDLDKDRKIEGLACIQAILKKRYNSKEAICDEYCKSVGVPLDFIWLSSMQDRYNKLAALSKKGLREEVKNLERRVDEINDWISDGSNGYRKIDKTVINSESIERQLYHIHTYMMD
ncbi:MAG: hypothetical protein ACRCX2_17995 [Paraclostridium sp.]